MEFNTINIEQLYFQMVLEQRDNCNTVINAVSTASGVNFTSNFYFLSGKPPEDTMTLFKQQLNRIANYSCKTTLNLW